MSSSSSSPPSTSTHPPASAFNDFLLKSNPEWDRLLIACQKNNVALVRQCLEEGVDPSHANPAKQSASHIAAWWAHVDCLQILLEGGANVRAANALTGATPLHGCLQSSKAALVKSKRLKCIELLLRAGADPDALDNLGRKPIDYLGENDIDRQVVINLFESLQQESPFQKLLEALYDNDGSLDQMERCWNDVCTTCDQSDSSQKQQLGSFLSSELLSLLQEWVERVEQTIEVDEENEATTQMDARDHNFYFERIEWIWKKLIGHEQTNVNSLEDGDSTSSSITAIRKEALDILGMSMLNRYGHVHKKPSCGDSLIRDDPALYSLSNTAILFSEQGGQTKNATSGNNAIAESDNQNNIEQAWMTIARRNYFGLAELWWDRLGIRPIGITNRQGMTALQFAARSGHLHMVQWLLHHQVTMSDNSDPDNGRSNDENDDNDNTNTMSLLDWVQHQDFKGQTALTAAQVNQHDEIARIIQDFIATHVS